MGLSLPYPDLVDRDTTTPGMWHIASPEGKHLYWCGAARDPNLPYRIGDKSEVDCVVCEDLYSVNGPWWRQ